jgi:hypothetical protein
MRAETTKLLAPRTTELRREVACAEAQNLRWPVLSNPRRPGVPSPGWFTRPTEPKSQGGARPLPGAAQRMRGPSTSEFEHKHVRRIADSDDPFDVLAGEIARARRRLLSTTHNRERGVISASTILILTETQYQRFQTGVERGYLQNHAYQCAVTVTAATDTVTY